MFARKKFYLFITLISLTCSFLGFNNNPDLAIGVISLRSGVSVEQALANGCRDSRSLHTIVGEALKNPLIGTTTKNKLSNITSIRNNWVTFDYVTDHNTWGFRGPTISGEVKTMMEEGELLYKARRFSRDINFWLTDGPQVLPRPISKDDMTWHNNMSLSLQILATSSSDEPKSQFVSVALEESVAESFVSSSAKGDNRAVYKFQMNPQSPIFGMQECDVKKGEVQFQVPGGTPIRNLQRKKLLNGGKWSSWEKYENKSWIPVNNEDKDELR